MKTLILIEDFDIKVVLEVLASHPNSRVIGLSPMACWGLDKAMVKHGIPEDYGAWSDAKDVAYQEWFVGTWIPTLAKEFGISMQELMLLMTPLRFMMEAFLRRARHVRWIMERERPDRVHYVLSRSKERDPIDDDLYRKGGSLFHSVFGAFAPDMTTSWVGGLDSDGRRFEKWLRRRLRGWYDWARAARVLKWGGYGGARFCFTSVLPGMMCRVAQAGHRAAVLPRFESEAELWGDWPVFIARALVELSRFTGFPMAVCDCLLPQLNQFFHSFLPKVQDLRGRYKIFFKPFGFYYIIFNRRNKPHLYAAHMAARDMGIKTVYVRHGWSADDAWENRYTRLSTFDYFIPLAQVDHEFYVNQARELEVDCEVL